MDDAGIVATILSALPQSWDTWITLLVSFCAAISSVWTTPSDKAPLWYRLAYRIVNAIGFNVGKAKNADDVKKKEARESS